MSKRVTSKSGAATRSVSTNILKDRKRRAIKAIEEALLFFENAPVFSFILVVHKSKCALGPNLISAIELADCTLYGGDYTGPFPESTFKEKQAEALRRCEEVVATVEQRLQQLRESGARFTVCWRAFGERTSHLDHTLDYTEAKAWDALADFLQHEVAENFHL